MLDFRTVPDFFAEVRAAPGQGPFHVRGSAYLFHEHWVKEFLPGGTRAQRDGLGEFGAHPFFDTIFIPSGMYDVFPLVALGIACAQIRRETLEQLTLTRARYQAEQDIRHFRKWLVKLASPTAVAARLPSIAANYFDFSTADAEVQDLAATCVLRSVPETISQWMVWTCLGFGLYALEVNGAKELQTSSKITPQGKLYRGYPMTDISMTFRWAPTR